MATLAAHTGVPQWEWPKHPRAYLDWALIQLAVTNEVAKGADDRRH